MRTRAAGFTLIELTIALSLVGLAMVGSVRLLQQLGQSRDAFAAASIVETQRANGIALLRSAVYRTESGNELDRRFAGSDREVSFASWCDVPQGWVEQCLVRLTMESKGGGTSLSARLGTSSLPLWSYGGPGAAEFRFAGGGGRGESVRWSRSWSPSVSLPDAVAIVANGDTMVFAIGARP